MGLEREDPAKNAAVRRSRNGKGKAGVKVQVQANGRKPSSKGNASGKPVEKAPTSPEKGLRRSARKSGQ